MQVEEVTPTPGNISSVADVHMTEAPVFSGVGTHVPVPFAPTTIADYERQEDIFKFVVTNTTPIGQMASVPVLWALVKSLTNQNQVFWAYDSFRYKSIHIDIVPTGASALMNGASRFSALPYDAFIENPDATDDFRHSAIPNTLLPFSHNETLSFDIPWMCNTSVRRTLSLYNEMNGSSTDYTQFHPRLHQTVALPLSNASGVACQVTYIVWARFEGLELFHYCGRSVSAPPTYPAFASGVVRSWSLNTTHAFGKGSKEAVAKTEKGVVSGIAGTVRNVSSAIGSVVPLPIFNLVSTVAGGIESIANAFGFDKPAQVSAVSMTQHAVGNDLMPIEGLDQAVKFNVSQDTVDAFDTKVMGAYVNEANVQQYASSFGAIALYSDPGTSTYPAILGSVPVNPSMQLQATDKSTYKPPLGQAARFFNRWRGDIRYRLHCHLDGYSDAQVFIGLSTTDNAGSYIPTNSARKVFKMKGSCVVDFEIPWHNLKDWGIVGPTIADYNYVVVVGLMDAVRRQGTAVAATFMLEVAGSATPGRLEFATPRTFSQATGYLLDLSPTPLGLNGDSAIVPIHSFIDLMKRYTDYDSQLPQTFWQPNLVSATGSRHPFKEFLNMFHNHRGSFRIRYYIGQSGEGDYSFVHNVQPTAAEVSATLTNNVAGTLPRFSKINPEVAFELMYDSPLYFATLPGAQRGGEVYWPGIQTAYLSSTSATTACQSWIALGDDYFACGRMCPPMYTNTTLLQRKYPTSVPPTLINKKARSLDEESSSSTEISAPFDEKPRLFF
jgi:hypothetical protein